MESILSSTQKQDAKCKELTECPPDQAPPPCTDCANGKKSVAEAGAGKGKIKHEVDLNLSLPTEELLGSVTTFHPNGGPENGHALRTSARVIHKMRMDSIRGTTPPPHDKKDATKPNQSLPKTPSHPKSNRVVWGNSDKNLFFEALNEYGKDFESIANYLNAKNRRKNSNEILFKIKDVRHLFYQFNQKLSKYLQFSDDVKKEAQELYALINYGEMRKKVPFLNKKYFFKLRDLVYKGMATIREKGKNIRFKTPSCRALRKLNQLEEWQEEIKLPPRIDVILKPANYDAWGRVQNLAQNPRIKTTVTLQKRVAALLQTLQQKWRSHDVRLAEKLKTLQTTNANSNSKTSRLKAQHDHEMNCKLVNNNQVIEPSLCFAPPQNAIIHRPMINLTEFLSSYSICLNSYEQRIGAKIRGESLCSEKINNLKEMMKANTKRQRHDSGCEKHSPDNKKLKHELKDVKEEILINNFNDILKSPNASNESTEIKDIESSDNEYIMNPEALDLKSPDSNDSIKLIKMEMEIPDMHAIKINDNSSNSNDDDILMPYNLKSDKISTTSATMTCDNSDYNSDDLIKTVKRRDSNKYNTKRKETKHKDLTNASYRPLISDEVLQKIREGWTIANAGDLTFGDLYIMFGQEIKLNLEYSWVGASQYDQCYDVAAEHSISNKLKQLLLIANMTEKSGKKKVGCNCGHVCDKKVKKIEVAEPSASATSDNVLFKQPLIPMRNNTLAITNYSHQNMRYKQSRWWRMRSNRPIFSTKQVVVQRVLPVQPGLLAIDLESDVDKTKQNVTSSTSHQNQNDTINSTNEDDDEDDDGVDDDDDHLTKLLEDKINKFHSKASTSSSSMSPDLDSSMSLSLFDISLPSSSSASLIGALVCEDDNVSSNLSSVSGMKLLRESPMDDKLLDPEIHDLSLSSFLGHLDAVYESTEKKVKVNNQDTDNNISILSESSIDYIARFEDIAAELRAQDPT